MNEMIIYEQPLNEIIRVCLRLEQIFNQIDHQLPDTSEQGTRNLITYIINILHLLDRPDLKAKLAKELTHQLTNLMRYNQSPNIDSAKLRDLISQLEDLSRALIDSSGKIGYRLRDTELLNTLRLHLASPGGGCSFDLPLFHFWLEQPVQTRMTTIQGWLNDFSQIRSSVTVLLNLVRENVKSERKTAVHGFHQELLDPQSNLRMLRIRISRDISAFPEISVGRHFLSVRFFIPDIEKRPTQYNENLDFELEYCN
ncbi:MAG TPA: cell division protein ZapD [Gammaproteobacteria bacterium]|jgi:cell division protein ZapD|nr:cell division protein ZapD [Gammaproteobacteria bacterium]